MMKKYKSENGTQTSYQWDALGRLTDVYYDDGATIHHVKYLYNADGERVYELQDGSLTGFLYDDGKLIAEYGDAGFITAQYIHGLGLGHDVGSLICKETSESTAYYFYNYRGDVIDTLIGATVTSYRYDAFGNLIDSSAPQIGFSSKRYDSSTALSYFGARYYDSTTGRFISRDPLGFIDGPNGYIYVSNNPILLIDPFGLSPKRGVNSVIKAGLATATGLLAIPSPDDLVTVPLILASTAAVYAVSQYGAMVVDEIEQIITPHREVNIINDIPAMQTQKPISTVLPETKITYEMETFPQLYLHDNLETFPVHNTNSSLINYTAPKRQDGQYSPPPKTLPAFPDAVRKGRVQGRDAWVRPNGDILTWDYRHGKVEKFNKRGKNKGKFDPKTGKQERGPDSRRNFKP